MCLFSCSRGEQVPAVVAVLAAVCTVTKLHNHSYIHQGRQTFILGA
jgi:hypothetical protein